MRVIATSLFRRRSNLLLKKQKPSRQKRDGFFMTFRQTLYIQIIKAPVRWLISSHCNLLNVNPLYNQIPFIFQAYFLFIKNLKIIFERLVRNLWLIISFPNQPEHYKTWLLISNNRRCFQRF